MAKLQNFNGRYCESEYENAFLAFLEQEGWNYLAGNSILQISLYSTCIFQDKLYFSLYSL